MTRHIEFFMLNKFRCVLEQDLVCKYLWILMKENALWNLMQKYDVRNNFLITPVISVLCVMSSATLHEAEICHTILTFRLRV